MPTNSNKFNIKFGLPGKRKYPRIAQPRLIGFINDFGHDRSSKEDFSLSLLNSLWNIGNDTGR